MAQSNAQRLINLGFPAEQAKILEEMIAEASGGAGYTDSDARNAIATKTEVASLTSASTAEDIVSALQA